MKNNQLRLARFELGMSGKDVIHMLEFKVLPMCWKVERAFGWANHLRRLSKDFEIQDSK
ncbi:MAG: hypothetical protein PHO46_07975 [Thermoguttaceae bacterium]|nr:hypothetical protein [Thermoguttaceae bacterium]